MVFFRKIISEFLGQIGLYYRNLNDQVEKETQNKNCARNRKSYFK